MLPGIIKICKKIIIESSTKMNDEQEMLQSCFNEVNRIFLDIRPSIYQWSEFKATRPELVETFNKNAEEVAGVHARRILNKANTVYSDVLGYKKIPYKDYDIEIIDCDFNSLRMSKYDNCKLALFLITDELTLIDVFDNKLLLGVGDKSKDLNEHKNIETFMIELHDSSILSYRRILKEHLTNQSLLLQDEDNYRY